MREIKFRAWDKIENCIAPIEEIHFGTKWVAIPVNDEDGGHLEQRKFDDIEIMQYTGLKDKNGKEIYEGDILRGKWKEAKINPESISVCPPITEGFHFYSEMEDREDEIIGNIFETPELLTNK